MSSNGFKKEKKDGGAERMRGSRNLCLEKEKEEQNTRNNDGNMFRTLSLYP